MITFDPSDLEMRLRYMLPLTLIGHHTLDAQLQHQI